MKRMKKFQEQYANGTIALDPINHSFKSWLGHARQAHTFALRKGLLKKIAFKRNG